MCACIVPKSLNNTIRSKRSWVSTPDTALLFVSSHTAPFAYHHITSSRSAADAARLALDILQVPYVAATILCDLRDSCCRTGMGQASHSTKGLLQHWPGC
ncbi:hypothetical protein H0G86_006240 [Trichoderma simmonsii]|uniref:Uncharacterized protein n=1 Tax=Trichoderma simmonsii TaxID=1491479 RepID=A0A8G0PJQ3_9HYPO|nr:hypothetical protein H0G86_006240 [Trichoderma simmonsii]